MAFGSEASDLVANDTNGTRDVFVRDLQLGTTTLVSINRFGTGSGNGLSGWPRCPRDQRRRPFRGIQQRCDATWWPTIPTVHRLVRAGSADWDDYVGEHQLVWNGIWQWSSRAARGASRDQRGRPFRGVPKLCDRLGGQTIPTVPATCLCVLSRPEEVRNSGSFTGVAQSFTAPT